MTDVLYGKVIGCAIEVHRHLGPGVLESCYEQCLAHEFHRNHLSFERQSALGLRYKDIFVEGAYRLDFIVEGALVVELKAVPALAPVHTAQLLTYLRFTKIPHGLLINFHETLLKHGLKRCVLF